MTRPCKRSVVSDGAWARATSPNLGVWLARARHGQRRELLQLEELLHGVLQRLRVQGQQADILDIDILDGPAVRAGEVALLGKREEE